MKAGTNVSLDKNLKNIRVGDHVRDILGFIYEIDAYGMAVKKDDGSKHKIADLGILELYIPEDTTKPIDSEYIEITPLDMATDQELAAELRRRGYEVKATKTTIVEL